MSKRLPLPVPAAPLESPQVPAFETATPPSGSRRRALASGTTPTPVLPLESFGITIAGRRANNEDAICVRPELGLFVVADGMGGYEGGEVASAIAVDTIYELVLKRASGGNPSWPYRVDGRRSIHENEILVATKLASARIASGRRGGLKQMGSTVAVLRIVGDRMVIAHVGDSRVYRWRAGKLVQMTTDHSLVAQLQALGTSPEDLAMFPGRHVVTRALGVTPHEPDVHLDRVAADDVFLLCTDGLTEVLPPASISFLLDAPPELACRRLIDAAVSAGSRDNVSAIVVRVGCPTAPAG